MFALLSVKQKIVFSLWTTTFLVLTIAGILASFWFTRDQEARLDDFLVRECRGVQDLMNTYFNVNSGEGPAFDSVNNKEFRSFLDAYFGERLNRVQSYKTTLGIFALDGTPIQSTNAALNLNVPGIEAKKDLQWITVPGPHAYRLVVLPIVHNGQILGSIRLACLTLSLEEAWDSFLFSLVTVLILVFLAFGLLGMSLIHWSFRPVRQMSISAEDISESHLDLRLVVPPGQDEVAQMAETLNRLLARLERDYQFEEALVGQLSHELRTPLTILRGRNEVALDRGVGGEVQSILEDNLADIDGVVSLLNTLLNLARLDGRKDLVDRQPCDLVLILQDLVEELEPLWSEKDLSFRLVLPGNTSAWSQCPPVEVRGDPLLLRQAFLNVLTNAFKYTPRGSRIHLTIDEVMAPSGLEWRLTFRNPGPPIPEDALDLVFKRFYRVEIQDPGRFEKTSGLGQKGFGLGLSISKTMVELHHGSIRAYNPPTGGAAFEIRLPHFVSERTV